MIEENPPLSSPEEGTENTSGQENPQFENSTVNSESAPVINAEGTEPVKTVSEDVVDIMVEEPEVLKDSVPESEEQFLEAAPGELTDEKHDDEEDSELHDVDDFSTHSREELVTLLENYIDEVEVPRFKSKIATLRDLLIHTFQQESEEMLARFVEDGGVRDDFQPAPNPLEIRFQQALKKFNRKKIEYQARIERQRQENLETKKEILVQLKDVIQNEDNMSNAFNRFHELQARWRGVGPVPGADVRDLQLTYKFYVDKFYDYIKINRELQELDQKHNLEAKLTLCEQAEELIMEPSINEAFRKLHQLQDKWRETGPVPREKKNEIWDRFKSACDKIFEAKKEHLRQLEEQRSNNLETKTRLCEQVEAIGIQESWKHKEWQEATERISEIQNAWKKTGPANRKQNDDIWNRFRAACDVFYKSKNEFYHRRKQEFAANMQLKTELCIQAEALQNSTDWKATTAELKRLQEEWKKIGHVGERGSERIWKRFRTACDTFFKNKSEHFASMDKSQEENLLRKTGLIEQIENFSAGDDFHSAFEELKNFQRAWSELGMVPLNKKDEINKRYKSAIDSQFDKIKMNSGERGRFHSRPKTECVRHHDDTKKMDGERKFLLHKISELKNDVQVWENNIGFFAKSKNAEKLKMEFEEKISNAKKEIESLKEKLDTSDKS